MDERQQSLLKMLPGIDYLMELSRKERFFDNTPKPVLIRSAREVIDELRNKILTNNWDWKSDHLTVVNILERLRNRVNKSMSLNLVRTVNATGVVIHTNLGRSLLADPVLESLQTIGGRYSNLEFDLSTGKRGSRYTCVEDILCELSGAEAAMAVNNNAAAVLLCLETLAKGKKVIISRGELVEIGGSFRIPDVMSKSGAILAEVGTTNRTHPEDYINAIDEETALILKVHKSNYHIVGFTSEVSLKELRKIGKEKGIPVMEDLGSGNFIDLSQHGIKKEPTVQDSIAAGVDLVTFSGDKLLGGPQAGIIVGTPHYIRKIRKNPLTRALRLDRLTLCALENTLHLYRDPEKAVEAIPTLRMLTAPLRFIEIKAKQLASLLEKLDAGRMSVEIKNLSSRVGGGALPLQELPSQCVAVTIEGMSPNALERRMRENDPPIIGRIEEDHFIMDLRTIQDDELPIIETAFINLLKKV